MKKHLLLALAIGALTFTSCSQDDYSVTENMKEDKVVEDKVVEDKVVEDKVVEVKKAELKVSTELLDFGDIDIVTAIESDKELELTITNIGTADLEITEVKITIIQDGEPRISNKKRGNSNLITRAIAAENKYTCDLVPTTISPSSSKKTKITLHPQNAWGNFTAKLEIKTNAGLKTISLKANLVKSNNI